MITLLSLTVLRLSTNQPAAQILRGVGEWSSQERVSGLVRPLVGLLIVLAIYTVVKRNPWPRPFRLSFAVLHLVLAPVAVGGWIVLSRLIEALILGPGDTVPYESEFVLIGTIAYLIVTGISYSVESTARAARAEAAAASTQLAALRAQLHPHFLFNALHTVVQLIPVQPALAMEAAEMVAELLRSSLDERREEVPLRDEWRFVSRYLAVERIRFGDRLVVRDMLDVDALDALVPTFALQTLVENAVRHGAAPRVAPTDIELIAQRTRGALTITVRNSWDQQPVSDQASGTGLARLRERLMVLHGNAATLQCVAGTEHYDALLTVPQTT